MIQHAIGSPLCTTNAECSFVVRAQQPSSAALSSAALLLS
jgi:hypothetical protein